MGKPTGFLEIDKQERTYKPVEERLQHFDEFVIALTDKDLIDQGARCMDCGIPYCHSSCPVNNIIPEWNDLVYQDDFKRALRVLHSTNNFPEFTGKICPAPCEAACTLNIDDNPVSIRTIECAIVDKGWKEGWIKPRIAKTKTGKKVAVIGGGPAGMAASQQLARVGHNVTLFEKQQNIGGLMRYGIPNFKLDKSIIDRRLEQMQAEGVTFKTNTHIGIDISFDQLKADFDAILMTGGAEAPRDLPIEGRNANGIHFAMDFLKQANQRKTGESFDEADILATAKHVLVIGGGDTGSDCIGTSARQNAATITQVEIMPKPPEKEDKNATWPDWPNKMRTSTSQQEGVERQWSIATQALIVKDGNIVGAKLVHVDNQLQPIAGTEFTLKTDLVLLAMGFIHPTQTGMLEQAGVDLDGRNNVAANTDDYQTSQEKVFAAGDMRRGQSLVVWAIREGRQAAQSIDKFLMGTTNLA
jgi:glutamate synthase (NADPH/NADH) small chain